MALPPGSIARAFADAYAAGTGGSLTDVTAEGATMWHNNDHAEAPFDASGIAILHGLVEGLEMTVIRHEEFGGGELLELCLRGTVLATGAVLDARNCIVFTVEDGVMTRLAEYVDPGLLTALGA